MNKLQYSIEPNSVYKIVKLRYQFVHQSFSSWVRKKDSRQEIDKVVLYCLFDKQSNNHCHLKWRLYDVGPSFAISTAGMSNSNPCVGRTTTFREWKTVSGPQFGNILNFLNVRKPFHKKYVSFKHFDAV
jgi:hypothetical protein